MQITLLGEQSFRVKLLFLHIINIKEQVSDPSIIGLKRTSHSLCGPSTEFKADWLSPDPAELSLVWPRWFLWLQVLSVLVGAGGEQQRRWSVHTGQRQWDVSIQQGGKLQGDITLRGRNHPANI